MVGQSHPVLTSTEHCLPLALFTQITFCYCRSSRMFNLQQALGDNASQGFDSSVIALQEDHYDMLSCHCNAVHCLDLSCRQNQFTSQSYHHQPSTCLFTESQMPSGFCSTVWNESHMREVVDSSQCSSALNSYYPWSRTTQQPTLCDTLASTEANLVCLANQAAFPNSTVWCNTEMVSSEHLARCSCRVIEVDCSCANKTSLGWHSRTHLSNVTNVLHHSWSEFTQELESTPELKLEVDDEWQPDGHCGTMVSSAEWPVLSNPMLSDTRAPSRTDECSFEHDDMHDLHKLEFIFDKPLPDNLYYGMIAELNDNSMENAMHMPSDELEFPDDKTLLVLDKSNTHVLESSVLQAENCTHKQEKVLSDISYDNGQPEKNVESGPSSSDHHQEYEFFDLKVVEEKEVVRPQTPTPPIVKLCDKVKTTMKKCKPKVAVERVRKCAVLKNKLSRISAKARPSFDLVKLLDRCRKLKKAGKVEDLSQTLAQYDTGDSSQIGLIVNCLSKMYVQSVPSEAMQVLRDNHFDTGYRRELVQVWFDAVVASAVHQGDQMYPVKAHRLRKRNPPPATIWDGSRLKYSLKVQDTNVLLDFFYTVSRYPSSEQKQKLVRQTSMTLKQVSSWFKNHRIRIASSPNHSLSSNSSKKTSSWKKKSTKKENCYESDTDPLEDYDEDSS